MQRIQIERPLPVILHGVIGQMRFAVQFHAKTGFSAVKIKDIGTDTVLTPEFESAQTSLLQLHP